MTGAEESGEYGSVFENNNRVFIRRIFNSNTFMSSGINCRGEDEWKDINYVPVYYENGKFWYGYECEF